LQRNAERFIRSIKEKCLKRVILLGEEYLRRRLDEYVVHYHHELNHQGLGKELIENSTLERGPVQSGNVSPSVATELLLLGGLDATSGPRQSAQLSDSTGITEDAVNFVCSNGF